MNRAFLTASAITVIAAGVPILALWANADPASSQAPHTQPTTKPRPAEHLTLNLVMISESWRDNPQHQPEYIFVIGSSVGFKTVDSLKRYIADMPEGSTLTWAPGCCRMGGEPLLNDEKAYNAFVDHCKAHKVTLIRVPSG